MSETVYAELPEIVRQILGKVRRDLQSSMAQHRLKLSLPEAHSLHLIANGCATKPQHIAVQSGFDKAVVTRALKSLESYGYITKQQDTEDRRCFNLSMTDNGIEAWNRFSVARQESSSRVFQALDHSEQKQLAELLQKCL